MSRQGLAQAPVWAATPYAAFLANVADVNGVGRTDDENFRAACQLAAQLNNGRVSLNVVAPILANAGIEIEHHRYAALWAPNTGPGRVMVWRGEWELRRGSSSRNDAKPIKVRVWVGEAPDDQAACLIPSPFVSTVIAA